ncbi:hypothetical protein BH20BAC1_BH20BAC1_20720 [soil metagenome]
MIKGFYLFSFFFFAITLGCSQSSHLIKTSAFKRNIIGGASPGVTLHEDGTVTKNKSTPGEQYFIFIETRDSTRPEIAYLILDNRKYHAEVDALGELPFVLTDNDGILADTLIAATPHRVWNVSLGEAFPDESNKSENTSGEIILFIKEKNTLRSFPIKEIKQLPAKRLD